ncbi:MAG: stalk domain-containing protein [Syntrophomonas sp.]
MKRFRQYLLISLVFLIFSTTSALAANEVVGSYRISLDKAVSPENAFNALTAAQFINGTVIPAGAIFSYDQAVGPRYQSRGFILGLVTSGATYTSDYGGGICMTSGILHQAVKSAGLTVVERHNHSHSPDYLPSGEDAAITRGVEDYRFKNTLNYPLLIQTGQSDDSLEVNLIVQKPDSILIEVNGDPLYSDVQPLLKEDRLMVPIRAIAESIGAVVTWDENTKRVNFTKNMQNIDFKVGSSEYQHNGQTNTLETPPLILGGRTLVPLRLVAESMNLTVAWDEVQKKVLLNSQPTAETSQTQDQVTE